MKEVFGDVFIGDRDDALCCLSGEKEGMKRILTVDIEPLPSTQVDHNVLLKHVPCLDEPEADLLSHLDSCIKFIEDGMKDSKVLVHCWAGVSRSATVILAFVMQTQNIELNKALEVLKEVYPKADPNPGFLYQLQLFEAMGRKVDTASSLYKQFRLQIIAKKLEKAGCEQLPGDILENLASDSTSRGPVVGLKETVYKCRKCRYQLFKSTNCLVHKPGTAEDFLPWYSRTLIDEDQTTNRSNCTSHFIEPVQWMMPLLIGTAQGKLACPKCSGRIGSFNWAGEQCSCGRWVTPAFRLHKSRIDEG